MIILLFILLLAPSIVFGQTTNSRIQAGDGTPITDTTNGRLDVTVQNPVNAAQSGTWNVTNVSGTVSLPTGAATETTLGTRLADATFTGRFPAAFASADNIAAQTATFIHGGLFAWDSGGGNWDRLLLTSGALHVNVQNASLAVTQSGAWSLTANAGSNLNTSALALESGGNLAGLNGKFPAAAALANDTANPTLSAIASYNMCFDGATWDRCANMATDTDDNSLASGQVTGIDISLNYGFDGTNWVRQRAFSSADNIAAQVGQFMHGGLMAWDSGGSNWDRVLIASGRLQVDGSGVTQPISGTVTVGTFPDNEPFNLSQIGGNAVSAGVGVSGTGTLRVAAILHDGTDTASVTAAGRLEVECGNCSGSGATHVDDAAFTATSDDVAPLGALYDTTPPAITDGRVGVARMNSNRALMVDGSGVTQPVSGTVTVTDGAGALNVIVDSGSLTANAGTNLNTSALALESGGNLATVAGVVDATGTAVPANTLFVGGTDGTNTRALKTDSSGELQVDVLTLPSVTIGTFPDNEPFNVAQINGSTVQVASNSLNTTGAGLQAQAMVGQCDDTSPTSLTENQFGHARINCTTHHQLVEVGAALPTGANTIGNVNPGTATNWGIYAEDNGETAGGNLMMAGTVRRDTAASSAGSTGDNATLNTDATGLLWTRLIDPCTSAAKTYLPINISTAATTEITPSLAGGSNHYYVCSLVLITAAANNVALVDDDSDGCGSVTSGLAGGTTAASGFNMAANGGLTFGNGLGAVFKTGGTNRVLCLVTSASTQLSGTMTVVAAP